MSADSYKELKRHLGHKIVCVAYGGDGEEPWNVSIECEDCNEVLLDYDRDEKADVGLMQNKELRWKG